MKKISLLFILAITLVGFIQKDKNMITLNPLTGSEYTLKIGQKALFETEIHPSTGLSASYHIKDTAIVGLKKSEHIYNKPSNERLMGGDKGTQQYIFIGKEVGKTQITCTVNWRGEAKETHVFEIKVVE